MSFAQPLALWGLLGLPVIVLIHFLQSRNRREEVSTLFLLDLLPEETRSGAVFTRIRNGLQLWLQLLAVLLFTLLLARPMWLRRESVQLAAVVVDSSTSMRAFRERAAADIESLLRQVDRTAGHTEWWIVPSDPTRPSLYRGSDTGAAVQALSELEFRSGPHPVRPVLTRMRRMLGPEGLLVLVTDHPPENPPAETVVLGIGEPLPNSGFTGVRFEPRADGATDWEASVAHFAPEPATRTIRMSLGEGVVTEIPVSLQPGAVATVSGRLPPGIVRGRLELEPDVYDLDNVLPFVAPSVRPLPYAVALPPEAAAWAERVMATVPGAVSGSDPAVAWRGMPGMPPPPGHPAEILLAEGTEFGDFAQVAAVDHDLTRDLNWSGFLGKPVKTPALAPGEQVLVWMGESPLVTLREDDGRAQLMLRFDFESSNADRLPAMVLMLHRFLLRAQRDLPGVERTNLETRQRLEPPRRRFQELSWTFLPLEGGEESRVLTSYPQTAPNQPGFLTVRSGEEELLRAGVYAGDVEEADLRRASRRDLPEDLLMRRRKRNSETDFLRPLWFSLLGLTLVGAWWAGGRGGAA